MTGEVDRGVSTFAEEVIACGNETKAWRLSQIEDRVVADAGPCGRGSCGCAARSNFDFSSLAVVELG